MERLLAEDSGYAEMTEVGGDVQVAVPQSGTLSSRRCAGTVTEERRLDEADEDEQAFSAVHEWRKDHANQAQHKLDEVERKLMASYESLDYDVVRSDLFEASELRKSAADRSKDWLMNWVTFGAIGITTGFFAFLMDTSIKYINKARWGAVLPLVEAGKLTQAYFLYIFIVLTFGLISTTLVCYGEPVAAGDVGTIVMHFAGTVADPRTREGISADMGKKQGPSR